MLQYARMVSKSTSFLGLAVVGDDLIRLARRTDAETSASMSGLDE